MKKNLVAHCFLTWQHSFKGSPGEITAITDHQTLNYLMDEQVFTRSLIKCVRIGLFLLIRPTAKYHLGEGGTVSDVLRRIQ